MTRSRLRVGVAVVALGVWLVAASASAQTLDEALATAYANNPSLQAARAQLRQTDEQVPQALANWRPTVDIEGSIGKTWEQDHLRGSAAAAAGVGVGNSNGQKSNSREPKAASLNLTQPIYRGGRSVAQRDQAENLVSAGRAQLTSVEQQVLQQAVTAYVDVLRDTAVLDLTKSNEDVIAEQLKATRERFQVGEVTKTDVSQAESRLARAVSDHTQAQGNLASSRAIYRQVIGAPPGKLVVPELPGGLPSAEEETIALSENTPTVAQAIFLERASRDGTDVVFGELLPTVSLVGSLAADDEINQENLSSTSATISAQVVIPLYQAGDVASRVRESKQLTAQRRNELDNARRLAIQDATTAWEALATAKSQIESFTAEVEANKVAFEGVRQEQQVGLRTVLDVLDAQQEVLNSQVSLVVARRDTIVAAYQTLAAVGKLTAADLKLPAELYDPQKHYREVRDKWWGLDASGQ